MQISTEEYSEPTEHKDKQMLNTAMRLAETPTTTPTWQFKLKLQLKLKLKYSEYNKAQ